jgi:hypothetical protein
MAVRESVSLIGAQSKEADRGVEWVITGTKRAELIILTDKSRISPWLYRPK